jgi:hypothetical protein
MLASITNLGEDYSSVLIFTEAKDAEVADQLIVLLMGAILKEYYDSCDSCPTDFSSVEDWKASVLECYTALKKYSKINESDDTEEASIIQEAKSAIKFFAQYLEEFWV